MMGVTSLEAYNTVYNITGKNNKLQILLKYKQLDALELDTVVVPNIKKFDETYDLENKKFYYEFIENANICLTTSYNKKKLTKKDFEHYDAYAAKVEFIIKCKVYFP